MITRTIKKASYLMAVSLLALSISITAIQRRADAAANVGTVFDLAGDDEVSTGKVDIGFNFDFYGTTYTDAWVSTNGSMQFGPGTTDNTSGDSPESGIDNFISPFWDDIYTNDYNAKSIYHKTVGDPGSRKFILQWTDMSFCCDSNSMFGNFQIILYEATNTIRFQYFGLQNTDRSKGDSALIGIEKDDTTYNTFSINTIVLNSPTDAIEFTPNGSGGYTDNGHKVAYEDMSLGLSTVLPTMNLNSPANGATDISDAYPLLTWKAVEGATEYAVQVADTSDMVESSQSEDTNSSLAYVADVTPGHTYYWRVAAHIGDQYSYSEIRSFTMSPSPTNQEPDVPTSIGPVIYTAGGIVDPTTMLSTPFTFTIADPDSSQKVGYEFILSTTTDSDNSVIDYKSVSGDQGTQSFTYGRMSGGSYLKGSNATRLVDGTHYYVLVRAVDSNEGSSDFSASTDFVYNNTPTDDDDGITEATENDSPNSGDANDDGLPDAWEDNVSGFVNPTNGNYSVLQVEGPNAGDCKNTAANVLAESSQAAQDSTYSYPAGLMNFTVTCLTPGATAKITQIFYGTYTGTLVARKYNPNTKTYSLIPGAQIGTTTIGGQPAVRIEYFVTDGGALDQDGTANGTIVDPSGPAVLAAVTAPNTGLLPESQLLAPLLITIGAAAIYVNERQRRTTKSGKK